MIKNVGRKTKMIQNIKERGKNMLENGEKKI